MKIGFLAAAIIAVEVTLAVDAAPRVALMDFSVDDNSYRSARLAEEFTGFLQAQLADEPDVKWVERAQLDRIRQELELSAFERMGIGSSLHQGRLAKADWMITGQFSLDDRGRQTLFLEATELQHADVLASQTLILPDASKIQLDTNQVDQVAAAVKGLLSQASRAEREADGKILLAPLFVTGIRSSGFSFDASAVQKGFYELLERGIATNARLQLIRFPKAYRSTEESEMVLDGLVDADRDAWQKAADVYVWVTFAFARQRPPSFGQSLEINLYIWDGLSRPKIIKEELPASFSGIVDPDKLTAALGRLVSQTIAHAHKRQMQSNVEAIRHEIAESLVQTYNDMTGTGIGRDELGLHDPERFLQAVHVLETACFFDPDNANARELYIACRWGWWMDFGFKVKNEFWSKWRRSVAWGKFVDRFGFSSATEELPFPYGQEGGIPMAYLQSQEDVLRMFPQSFSTNEMTSDSAWWQGMIRATTREAENHGFPTEMPRDLAMQWKREAETERQRRLSKVAGFMSSDWKPDGKQPSMLLSAVVHGLLSEGETPSKRLALLEGIWHECVQVSRQFGPQWVLPPDGKSAIANLCREAGMNERSQQLLGQLSTNHIPMASRPVSAPPMTNTAPRTVPSTESPPQWVENMPRFSEVMIWLPDTLPVKVRPAIERVEFPAQSVVRNVLQMDFLGKRLLVLATDERSAPSSDPNAGVSAELLDEHNRLWILDPQTAGPVLYKPELFTNSIHSFLLTKDRLWVAGETTGYLELRTGRFHKFGFSDGFTHRSANAFAMANQSLFVAGDFSLDAYDPTADNLQNIPFPSGTLSQSTGRPHLLAGNGRWLTYIVGPTLLYDAAQHEWTNLPAMAPVACASDGSGFWFAGEEGLHFYDVNSRKFKTWATYCSLPAIMDIGSMGSPPGYRLPGTIPKLPKPMLDRLNDQIQDALLTMGSRRIHDASGKSSRPDGSDPLHVDGFIPGPLTAVANEGEYLWIGRDNYLFLFHKPTSSLVACCEVAARISSLLVSDSEVWIGLNAYGNEPVLVHLKKDTFFAIPRTRWLSLSLSSKQLDHLVASKGIRDQALYAFYAGDDAKVASLLKDIDPEKASLEEMVLLLFSYDVSGLDNLQLMKTWAGVIGKRFPNAPWSRAAEILVFENEQYLRTKARDSSLLAKYDRNHDGVLDSDERLAMEKDPDYLAEEESFLAAKRDDQLKEIMLRFDSNGDGELDRDELGRLDRQVKLFSHAPPGMLAGHQVLVAPLITAQFPSVSGLLQGYDADHDGAINLTELKSLAQGVKNER